MPPPCSVVTPAWSCDRRAIEIRFSAGLPVSQLRPGHYATGRTPWGAEVHIFCDAGRAVWNVATGERVTVNRWKRRWMLAEIFELLLLPFAWLIRDRRRAKADEIKRFYRTAAWRRARFDQLTRCPRCVYCGRSAKDGAKMNVDHILPLSRRWDLRLDPRNLPAFLQLGQGRALNRITYSVPTPGPKLR